MGLQPSSEANPHPSGDPIFVAEAIEEADGMVRVRYVGGAVAPAWWITAEAWRDWRRLDSAKVAAIRARETAQ